VQLSDLLRSPLALRIYLVGLAQMAVVAFGFSMLIRANRPLTPGAGHLGEQGYLVASLLARDLGDPAALERQLAEIRGHVRGQITVLDPDGRVLATTAPGAARCSREDHGRPPERRGAPCQTRDLAFPDGRAGTLELSFQPPPPSPINTRAFFLVLVVVSISSWLLARSLTRPLRRLSKTARAFGNGDLAARVGLARRDEFGDVARAFDEMAEHVTELLRAEKELLANISHELRTPLARIRVALDIASEGDADTARESLVDIAGDLDELERLITDVLTAARLDLGDGSSPIGIPPLRRQDVNIADLLAQSTARFRSAHPGRPLQVEIEADLPLIDGDPVLLRRVVDNLLENAHKYTEREAAGVDLVARAQGEAGIEIEVLDRGIGISASDLPQIFRPFFRADKSRTRATGGLGLGLALVRRIVDAHGGRITIESRPDEGTQARVWLPAARVPAG
jgi:signal transduction histidine kinase